MNLFGFKPLKLLSIILVLYPDILSSGDDHSSKKEQFERCLQMINMSDCCR